MLHATNSARNVGATLVIYSKYACATSSIFINMQYTHTHRRAHIYRGLYIYKYILFIIFNKLVFCICAHLYRVLLACRRKTFSSAMSNYYFIHFANWRHFSDVLVDISMYLAICSICGIYR